MNNGTFLIILTTIFPSLAILAFLISTTALIRTQQAQLQTSRRLRNLEAETVVLVVTIDRLLDFAETHRRRIQSLTNGLHATRRYVESEEYQRASSSRTPGIRHRETSASHAVQESRWGGTSRTPSIHRRPSWIPRPGDRFTSPFTGLRNVSNSRSVNREVSNGGNVDDERVNEPTERFGSRFSSDVTLVNSDSNATLVNSDGDRDREEPSSTVANLSSSHSSESSSIFSSLSGSTLVDLTLSGTTLVDSQSSNSDSVTLLPCRHSRDSLRCGPHTTRGRREGLTPEQTVQLEDLEAELREVEGEW